MPTVATQQQPTGGDGGFGFMQSTPQPASASMPQYSNNPAQPQQQPTEQQPQQRTLGGVFDPFDGLSGSSSAGNSGFGTSYNNTAAAPAPQNNAFDPFSGAQNAAPAGGNQALSDADMNLFKY